MNRQIVIRDLGKYGGTSGVNKLFHLMNVIDYLITCVGEKKMVDEVNKRLKESEGFYKFNNWADIKRKFKSLRPVLYTIQMEYDYMHSKKGRENPRYEKLCKKISPYQPEIYFMFNLLIDVTELNYLTIPAEAFKSPEISNLSRGISKAAKEVKDVKA
jgi:hypothetical protein